MDERFEGSSLREEVEEGVLNLNAMNPSRCRFRVLLDGEEGPGLSHIQSDNSNRVVLKRGYDAFDDPEKQGRRLDSFRFQAGRTLAIIEMIDDDKYSSAEFIVESAVPLPDETDQNFNYERIALKLAPIS